MAFFGCLLVALKVCWPAFASSLALPLRDSVDVQLFASFRFELVEFQSADGDSLIIMQANRHLVSLPPDEIATLELWEGMLRVRWSRGSAPVTSATIQGPTVIRVNPRGATDRIYRGTFKVTLDTQRGNSVHVVNRIDVEDYVASVLPSEYPFQEIEGVKAQAIVVRTYAMTNSHLRDDTGSQVYLGISSETDLSRRAVEITAASTIQFNGLDIEAVYSAHCGGHSANNEDIWGTEPIHYLRGQKDPYDHDAPVARWSASVDADDLNQKLSSRLQRQVKLVKVADRGKGGHVISVRIDFENGADEEIRGERFRSIVNRSFGRQLIPSSSFEIKRRSGRYDLKGRGSGHGVGFCQWGAAAQAKQGRSHEEILNHYYQDVSITRSSFDALAIRNDPGDDRPKRRPGW